MNHASVLQVEDDENDVLLLRYVFQTLAIPNPLHVASDGQRAIDYLAGAGDYADRARFPLPCVVLLDLKLPGKSGFQVLEWIRAQPSLTGLVVVVLTASAAQADVDRAYRLGANSFVVKPTGTRELAELVSSLQAWWMRHNRFGTVGARSAPTGGDG